jgi:hypothetical protein
MTKLSLRVAGVAGGGIIIGLLTACSGNWNEDGGEGGEGGAGGGGAVVVTAVSGVTVGPTGGCETSVVASGTGSAVTAVSGVTVGATTSGGSCPSSPGFQGCGVSSASTGTGGSVCGVTYCDPNGGADLFKQHCENGVCSCESPEGSCQCPWNGDCETPCCGTNELPY